MDKNEFEYNYYFELYKEKSVLGHEAFKGRFKKKHKTNINIQKLIHDIENYQIRKYGQIKFSDYYIQPIDYSKEQARATKREYTKLGLPKDREKK